MFANEKSFMYDPDYNNWKSKNQIDNWNNNKYYK